MTVERTEADQLWDGMHAARREADRANADIGKHEALCAERYKSIHASLDDIRAILKWGGIALVSVLGTIAWAYLRQSLNLP